MQRGAVTGGIWLIGVGLVFLIREVMDLGWGETWPLFIVLAGVGTGAGALMALSGRRIGAWGFVWALLVPALLIAVGLLLFVDVAGLADIDALELLAQWWPLALIGIGGFILVGALLPRQRGVEEHMSVPSHGLTDGEVVLKFGAGTLEVGSGRRGQLIEAELEGGARRRDLGPGRIELETDVVQVVPWLGQPQHWRIGLDPDLPIRLRLEGGASRHTLDLAGVQVTSLVVKTGASDTRIVLPAVVERCDVRIEAGAAQVRVEVPTGVAARIRSQIGLGTTTVDEARFPRSAGGWESPDYAGATRQVEIGITGGVGTVRVS